MKKKNLLGILAVALLSLGAAACGPTSNPSNPTVDPTVDPTTTPSVDPTTAPTSSAKVIQSITIADEYKNITTTVGDILYDFTEYYTIKPSGLSSKQKKVKVTIESGADCFEEDDGMFEAVKPGEAVFKITSNVNADIFDTMTVTVNDAYFERNAIADLTHELPENGGYVTVSNEMTTDIFIKTAPTTTFYYETSISFTSTAPTEYWPKIGLRVETVHPDEYANNAFVYFFDFPCTADEYASGAYNTKEWGNFGLCEISKGEGWAWNPGINNATARHNDCIYTLPQKIKAGEEFKMGMARIGSDYYLFANDIFACKFQPLFDLIPADVNTRFGFFEFNTNCTFSKYSYTVDAAEVSAKVADFVGADPLSNFADD